MRSKNSADIDPALLARLTAARTSRRRFIGGGAAAAAALALGPTVLAACGSDSGSGSSSATATDDGAPASGNLRISNWPLYMADGFIAAFETATGLTVDYKEDYNDNEEWFAKAKRAAVPRTGHRRRPRGADAVHGGAAQLARLAQRDQRIPAVPTRRTCCPN